MILNIIYLVIKMELLTIVSRTLFFYFFIIISYRIMGKREIGQLGIIDLIVSILIAELVAMSIENNTKSIYLTIIPIIILVILEIVLAFISLKSSKIRMFFDGKPSLIIAKGKINYHEMIKQRYNLDDLLINLREKEIRNIDEVEYAILEPNGKLSVFKNDLSKKNDFPLPLIIDGKLDIFSIKQINKTKIWIKKELDKKNIDISNVFYAFYKQGRVYIIKRNQQI